MTRQSGGSSSMRVRLRGVRSGSVMLAAALLAATGLLGPHASAAGIGSLLCPVTNTLGVTSAGWDDGATTPPTTLTAARQAIDANPLYAAGIDGSGIGVAVIDSGVVPVTGLTTAGKVINGPDLSFESQVPQLLHLDTYGHGTHLAGIIAGNDGSSSGFQDVAPGAHLVELEVASHDAGAADVSQVLAAIDWVVQHRNDPGLGIRVLNLAYGTESLQSHQLDPIAFAVENAWHHGIVTVVSGGNDGTTHGSLTDPAVDPYVLAVGAADVSDTNLPGSATVAPFSSRSSSRPVDVVAPGMSIESLRDPGSAIDQAHPGAVVAGRLFRGSGTSQATAVVSGAAALLLQEHPGLRPDEVKTALSATAVPLGLLDRSAAGSGLIDVGAAAQVSVGIAAQRWTRATGTGSIDQARGGARVAIDGTVLTGEQDIMGNPWHGASWAAASAAASAWNGGSWNGGVWTGASWSPGSGPGGTWSGAQWSGAQWSGAQWSGAQWSGAQWSGAQWS